MSMRFIAACAAASLALLASGCATIFTGGGSQKISIASTPPGASVSIANRTGEVVSKGVTPFEVKLKKGAGYFKGENYTLQFTMDGYQPEQTRLMPRISGWYFGNIAIGGVLGMVCIDPATGAMYKLEPKDVSVALKALKVAQAPEEGSVLIVSTTQLPPKILERMSAIRPH